jgi:hypothetical protein
MITTYDKRQAGDREPPIGAALRSALCRMHTIPNKGLCAMNWAAEALP